MSLTVYPLNPRGQVYGSPMSFGLYDPGGTLQQVRARASDGHNVLIHCFAGLGRTALFAALLAKDVFGLSGEEAINWLSQHKPDALVTPAQILMVLEGDR